MSELDNLGIEAIRVRKVGMGQKQGNVLSKDALWERRRWATNRAANLASRSRLEAAT